MDKLNNDYRGHTIFTHASGPSFGPFVASYSAWEIQLNNSYRAVSQGSLEGTFPSQDLANEAAFIEAQKNIDSLLDK